ncbi:PBP1A family penicillin-binding protein [Candidatus Nomurabacteria bacterium]|nr:PBP1A family penicillin-binding protein [Candidatus Nomurabacteria bacterium]USN94662.1 MAG: PBP1A family penicillin-binding protein [Candidatus Nomurabacteria bacterium]
MQRKKSKLRHGLEILFFGFGSFVLFGIASSIIWASTMEIPDFGAFEERKVASSTKIYDSTGEVLLYDVNKDIRRTVIPFEEMGDNIKNATVAIEDWKFYEHSGIRPTSIIRALFANLSSGSLSQGGSTITQQIVKNTLLTTDKKISRKIKEVILAVKVEQKLSKDEILTIYLNEAPYGGVVYGIKEASETFYGKDPAELTIAESAYLAAIPQAPTYYSPRGEHRDRLEERKNLVLSRMLDLNYITREEYDAAITEEVAFIPQEPNSIKAPHFVFMIKSLLEEKYGTDMVESGGLKVITTLDWELQKKVEETVKENAIKNEESWGAENQAAVAIDPKTGYILALTGSRDYFDKEIDGSFNVATAYRQPGSSFKPFVYATAFKKGYTPDTAIFDVPTEFQAGCDAYGNAVTVSQDKCYKPSNYDGAYLGPLTLRNALAQSRNIPAVKMLYLVGVTDSLKTAKEMGITSLGEKDQYGLTLVLGGGEVSPLEMASAYGVFANAGVRNPYTGILSVERKDGTVLESYAPKPETVLDRNVAALINDVLSDNVARTPLFGPTSFLYFGDRPVAGKTGTTNNNRDAWLVGYTPDVVVAVWSGNNDNTSMKKGSSISGPSFNAIMNEYLKDKPIAYFDEPIISYNETTKPIIRGYWQGGESFFIDTISGGLATNLTPEETKEEKIITNVHTILHWINKSDPTGPSPINPESDSQYSRWETAVQNWWAQNAYKYPEVFSGDKPGFFDDVHTEANIPDIEISNINNYQIFSNTSNVKIDVDTDSKYPIDSVSFFVNGIFLGVDETKPYSYSFSPMDFGFSGDVKISVSATDSVYNKVSDEKYITVIN